MSAPGTNELLRRWQGEADRDALDQLLQAEVGLLKARLRGPATPGSPGSATQEDVAQEAVLKLLAASPPPRFETPGSLRAYLWTAARNLLIDRLRRGRFAFQSLGHGQSETLTRDPATRGSVDRIERDDQAAALELALHLLRDQDQEILRLVYFEGLAIEEAGTRLGIPRDVANTRLVRARMRLGDKLTAWRELVLGE